MNYKSKYLKYKLKYLKTKHLYGGMSPGKDMVEEMDSLSLNEKNKDTSNLGSKEEKNNMEKNDVVRTELYLPYTQKNKLDPLEPDTGVWGEKFQGSPEDIEAYRNDLKKFTNKPSYLNIKKPIAKPVAKKPVAKKPKGK